MMDNKRNINYSLSQDVTKPQMDFEQFFYTIKLGVIMLQSPSSLPMVSQTLNFNSLCNY